MVFNFNHTVLNKPEQIGKTSRGDQGLEKKSFRLHKNHRKHWVVCITSGNKWMGFLKCKIFFFTIETNEKIQPIHTICKINHYDNR